MYYSESLSFDPRDPLFPVPQMPGVRWGVVVYTVENAYGLAPDTVTVRETHDGLDLQADGLTWGGQQQHAPGRVRAKVRVVDGAVSWHLEAWHSEPIKSIKLLLWGLPEPALETGWWHATAPEGRMTALGPRERWMPDPEPSAGNAPLLLWEYPGDLQTPWISAGEGDPTVCLSVRDAEVRNKRFFAHRPPYAGGGHVVEIVADELATRMGSHFAAPEMRLRVCHTPAAVERDFEDHLAFVESAYGLEPWETHPDVPAWAREIDLVLAISGEHWTGHVFNTFEQMGAALRFVAGEIPGDRVLAYVLGWEGRYYYQYPYFEPGELMGGDPGFRALCETAKQTGIRLMPMFGANGANARLYHDWELSSFRNATNRYPVLVNRPDWDGNRAGEDDQVFLNTAEPSFRAFLTQQLTTAIERYGLEAVNLDTTGVWFNDPRHDLYPGYLGLVEDLHARFPELLVSGEGWYDALLAPFPLNQSWFGVDRRYRFPQLLTRYARAFGHVVDGSPGLGSTGVHEYGFVPWIRPQATFGHIPTLGIVADTIAEHADEVRAVCRSAMRKH